MRRALRISVIAIVLGAFVWVMRHTQRSGHWWGDDWALYIRQAQALLDGNPNRVAVENAFTITHSKGQPFSPPLYPWGFPILLAPAVAAFGSNLDRLAVVEVACACVVALAWYALARRRLGTIVAIIGMVAVTLTPLLLSWTELIQSELPFMAVAFSALVAVDAAAYRNVFDPDSTYWTRRSWWWLVLVGFGAAAAFTVRREGLALIPAIAAAQFASLSTWPPPRRSGADPQAILATVRRRLPLPTSRGRYAARLALPYVVTATCVIALQVTMPSTVVPRYDGTSITNIWKYRVKIAANLAEVSGFKRAWESNPAVLGHPVAGWFVVLLYICLGVTGVCLGVTIFRRRDAHIAIYTLVAFVIGASFRSALNRYVASVGPLLLLLGLCAVATVVDRWQRRWTAVAIPGLIVLAIVAGNLANVHVRIRFADAYAANHAVEWGPTYPDSVAMFEAVRVLSDPGDVIAAPKARAMVLETGRNSIQVDDFRPIPADASVDLVVVERGTALQHKLDADGEHYEQAWGNARFVIFRVV